MRNDAPNPSRALGISSTSLPRDRTVLLAEHVASYGCTITDLALGRDQAWEVDFHSNESAFRTRDIHVACVGLKSELGNPDTEAAVLQAEARPFAATPLRVFLPERGVSYHAVREHLLALNLVGAAAPNIWVDTHQGHGSLAEILQVVDDFGLNIVADNEGLSFLSSDQAEALNRIGMRCKLLHLKGFSRVGSKLSTEHRPFAPTDADELCALMAATPGSVPVILQSRAGAVRADMAFIRECLSIVDQTRAST